MINRTTDVSECLDQVNVTQSLEEQQESELMRLSSGRVRDFPTARINFINQRFWRW